MVATFRWKAIGEYCVIREADEHGGRASARGDSERFAHATLDALSEHVAVLDARGNIVIVNRAWRKFAEANSHSPKGLSEGANYFAACASATGEGAEDAARFAAGLRAVINNEVDEFSLEYPCHSPTEQRWFIARATRFELDGEVRAVVTHSNITTRRLAEEATRFRSHLLNTVEQAVIATDAHGTIIYWNRFAEKLYGWLASEIVGRHIIEITPSQAAREQAFEIMSRLRAGESWSGELTVQRRDGTTFPAFITDTPIYDDKGTLVGMVGVSIDLTERKRAEEALRESEEQLRAIFEASHDGILVEQEERVVYVNNAYARLFGYERPEELIETHVSAVVSPDDRERMLEYGHRRLRGELAPTVYEFKGRRKDGLLIDLEASVSTHAVAGKTYITTAVRDITERKQAEEALRRSESKYRLLMEQASDGIHTYDLRGDFIETNSKLCEMLGYTREELLRLNVKDIIPAEDLAIAPIRFDELQAGQTILSERRLRRKDGTLLPVEISGRMIHDGMLQSIIRDISERKRAEEQLYKAYDELERRVEERTAELAHANETLKAEIAERLRAEEARNELLRRLVTAQEEQRRRISGELHDQMGQQLAALMIGLKTLDTDSYGRQSTRATLQQLQQLTDELSREAHNLAWELRPPALDDLGLHTALYNYVEEWAERSRVPVDFHSSGFEDGRLPLAHETALYRIAQEALTNVLKHSRADRVSFILERRGNHVLVVVEDNGKGFDAEALMEPSVKGRKLGLLGMGERASLLGGRLSVESRPGAGTSVFVRIPIPPDGEEGVSSRE
jgi:PAS domain S-box-containing protein